MKKKDWILAGSILFIAMIWLTARVLFSDTEDGIVTVTVDGQVYGTYALDQDQTIDIQGTNNLVIRDGTAAMEAANCPDQICVHQRAVSQAGQTIICLPNQVVVTVENTGEPAELDAVSN